MDGCCEAANRDDTGPAICIQLICATFLKVGTLGFLSESVLINYTA